MPPTKAKVEGEGAPPANKKAKLDGGDKADAEEVTSGFSKEDLMKDVVESAAVGMKVESATDGDIEKLIESGAKTAADLPDDKPLQSGQKVFCQLATGPEKLGQHYQAEILERRWKPESIPKQWVYYVHYLDFNRRLDSWVGPSLILLKGDMKMITADMVAKAEMIAKIEDESHSTMDHSEIIEHEKLTKLKNVNSIELGKYRIDAWYFSPFPPEYSNLDCLYFCEFCLTFKRNKSKLKSHQKKCQLRHPPGDEIYRNGGISMFEVDGYKNKIYCQNLCYLAKLFLDHKTLQYDVDPFLFYVMCEVDKFGAHMVGYFSKEKDSLDGYNLACILTMPQFQRKGYGKFLISFSYELSKKEGKVGSPEKPLSDLGLVTYRSYWTRKILTLLKDYEGPISVADISAEMAFTTADIIQTLQHLHLIRYHQGQHVLLVTPRRVERLLKNAGSEGLKVDASKIHWTPFNAKAASGVLSGRSVVDRS